MKRGDLVTVALQGKPRPALIIQADAFRETGHVTVLPLTSTLQNAPLVRLLVEPTASNNLQEISQVMIDRCTSLNPKKIGSVFGRIDDVSLLQINRLLAVFLGIA